MGWIEISKDKPYKKEKVESNLTYEEIYEGIEKLNQLHENRTKEIIDTHGYEYYASIYLHRDEWYTTLEQRLRNLEQRLGICDDYDELQPSSDDEEEYY